MPRRSPTIEGYKAVFAQPFLLFAEISWRWTLGSCGLLLLLLTAAEYLNTIPVTDTDVLLLNSGQRFLMLRALLHAFQGSGPRFAAALIIVIVALAIVWVIAGALGRAACLRALVDRFRTADALSSARPHVAHLMILNVLRALLVGATVLGSVGAMLIVTRTCPDLSAVQASFVLMALGFQIWFAWSMLNWILSTASIFVVRDGDQPMAAIASTVDFIRRRTGPVLAVGSAFGAAHLFLFAWAIAASLAVFVLARTSSPAVATFAGILISLMYFVAADILYVGRLAAYVCILEIPNSPPPAPFGPPAPSEFLLLTSASQVDQDEVILSDLPPSPSESDIPPN